MPNSFLANTDVKKVSEGMIKLVSSIEGFTKAEKCAIIASVFSCLYIHKLSHERSLTDVMCIVNNMRVDCRIKKLPEFGAAENFIKGEI